MVLLCIPSSACYTDANVLLRAVESFVLPCTVLNEHRMLTDESATPVRCSHRGAVTPIPNPAVADIAEAHGGSIGNRHARADCAVCHLMIALVRIHSRSPCVSLWSVATQAFPNTIHVPGQARVNLIYRAATRRSFEVSTVIAVVLGHYRLCSPVFRRSVVASMRVALLYVRERLAPPPTRST